MKRATTVWAVAIAAVWLAGCEMVALGPYRTGEMSVSERRMAARAQGGISDVPWAPGEMSGMAPAEPAPAPMDDQVARVAPGEAGEMPPVTDPEAIFYPSQYNVEPSDVTAYSAEPYGVAPSAGSVVYIQPQPTMIYNDPPRYAPVTGGWDSPYDNRGVAPVIRRGGDYGSTLGDPRFSNYRSLTPPRQSDIHDADGGLRYGGVGIGGHPPMGGIRREEYKQKSQELRDIEARIEKNQQKLAPIQAQQEIFDGKSNWHKQKIDNFTKQAQKARKAGDEARLQELREKKQNQWGSVYKREGQIREQEIKAKPYQNNINSLQNKANTLRQDLNRRSSGMGRGYNGRGRR